MKGRKTSSSNQLRQLNNPSTSSLAPATPLKSTSSAARKPANATTTPQPKQQQQHASSATSPINTYSSVEGTGLPMKRVRKKDAIESLITKPPMIVKPALSQLRYHILMDGLKVPKDSEDGICAYRPYVWSILLRVSPDDIPYTTYMNLVSRGPCPVYSKIRNDTFRTFTTDQKFRARVSENSLIRVLNSFAWQRILDDQNKIPSKTGGSSVSLSKPQQQQHSEFLYVQGMNVLAAPFLYQCKTEAQAFALFYTFLTRDCPLYICPTLEGAHTGLKLVDVCLEIIDPALFDYLKSKFLSAELYAFTSVLTFSAGTPPLTQALVLWDFLFAYGAHLNVLFVVAQLTLMRSELLESNSPMTLLRNFPQLQATDIIKLAISFVPLLPDGLYDLLQRHPFDPKVGQILAKQGSSAPNSSFTEQNALLKHRPSLHQLRTQRP